MTQQDNDKTNVARQNSPVAWMLGAVFIIAIVAAVFFYNGKDVGQQTTTTTPDNASSVTTGSKGAGTSNK
jgi:hypothetical protein